MKETKFFGTLKMGFIAFYKAFLPLILFELIYQTSIVLLVKPLFSLLTNTLMRLKGYPIALNGQIWEWMLTIPGILSLLLLAFLAIIFVYFEFAVVIQLFYQARKQEQPLIRRAILHALYSFRSLKSPSILLFMIYSLGLLPLVNMGVVSSLLPQLEIPRFITGEVEKTLLGKWLLLAAALLVAVVYAALLFVLPAMVLSHRRFLSAVRRSVRTIRRYGFKIVGLFIVCAAAWVILYLLAGVVFNHLFGYTNVSFWQAVTAYGVSFKTPFGVLIWIVLTLAQIMLMPLILSFLSGFYLSVESAVEPEEKAVEITERRVNKLTGGIRKIISLIVKAVKSLIQAILEIPFVQKRRVPLLITMIVFVGIALIVVLSNKGSMHDPITIAHRGTGYEIENTVEGFQSAIDLGADYVEVDVYLSKDGIPVVIHDSNLKRLTGQDINIYDKTAAQLTDIVLMQNGKVGRIPTLKEALDYCDEKILLAVEYKLHGQEKENLIDKVMELMDNYESQKKSIFVSLDYGLVKEMRKNYPEYLAGYCVYGNVGNLSAGVIESLNINFVLVEEWMVSRKLITNCNSVGVPIYVWTVNDQASMSKYLRLGISGLVTDYPDMAVKAVKEIYELSDRVGPYGEDEVAEDDEEF